MERGDQLAKRKTLTNRLDDKSLEDIFVNLPVKSLVRFKCVSKTWQSFIEDPSFVQLHLNRSKQHPQILIATSSGGGPVQVYSPMDGFKGGVAVHQVTIPESSEIAMLSPINGLFCFVDRYATRMYNLATRQFTPWAKTSITMQGGTQTPTYGFGFDPLTNKYKILCVWEISGIGLEYEMGKVDHICEVFTVGGENKWREIDVVPPVSRLAGGLTYANGSIYSRNGGRTAFHPPDTELIVAFDVGTEKFRVIQVPDFIVGSSGIIKSGSSFLIKCSTWRKKDWRKKDLLQIDGHMALMDRVDQYVVKLWISVDSYKEQKMTANWTEETISLPSSFLKGHCLCLAPVEGTDEIVIKSHIPSGSGQACPPGPRGFVNLYIYNRTMKSFREIEITGISPLLTSPFIYGMFVFHESLLPVQDADNKLDRSTPLV
ncbi:hypothetical protein MKW94_006519 [Papaver nudicaule]|uniref:F-box domain-containing protein n=1 Tax=Papaver nudicaule TaxID=74823 RepID=A0AA42B2E9_PAPNU|nr:hypothetical protein [Papaver nudicaule]